MLQSIVIGQYSVISDWLVVFKKGRSESLIRCRKAKTVQFSPLVPLFFVYKAIFFAMLLVSSVLGTGVLKAF